VHQGCKKDGNNDPVDTSPIILDCDYFESDRVLEDDPNRPVDYIVTCAAKVTGDVVINAGVVIEFEDDAGLNVSSGSLNVKGTASNKVVFTGIEKIKGYWRGIFFLSESINNKLDHAVVSYAGGNKFNSNNDRGNVICYQCKLSMTNTELSNGMEHGFNATYTSTDILAFDNNVITSNDKYPVISKTNLGHHYNGSNDYSGNGMDYILLEGGQPIGDDYTWESTNVPFLIDGNLKIGDGESLTLEAGAEILFDVDSEIDVSDGGYFASLGEASNMVTLSGMLEQPGAWLGIINLSSDPRNEIDFTEISYAGGGQHNSNGDLGTIVVWSNAYQKVTNTIIRDAALDNTCAINAPYSNETLVLENNTIVNIPEESCQ
jgi:hypothetical protein